MREEAAGIEEVKAAGIEEAEVATVGTEEDEGMLFSFKFISKKRLVFAFFSKFKNYEKCLVFHLKSSFRSQSLQIFVISLRFHILQIKKINENGIAYDIIKWLA